MFKKTGTLILTGKIIGLILLFYFLGGSFYNSAGASLHYRHELDELTEKFYRQGNTDGNTDEILAELERKEQELTEGEEDYSYFVQRAEIEIFRAEIKEVAEINSPEDNFARALEYAEQAIEEQNTARANRQAAESLSMLFNYRGTFFIIRNSGKAENYLDNARELTDDNNVMSRLIWANYYLQAPSTFGGDPEKGKEMFREIKELGHPVLELAALNSLGKKYEEQEELDEVENMRDRFSQLFPGSPWLEEFPLR